MVAYKSMPLIFHFICRHKLGCFVQHLDTAMELVCLRTCEVSTTASAVSVGINRIVLITVINSITIVHNFMLAVNCLFSPCLNRTHHLLLLTRSFSWFATHLASVTCATTQWITTTEQKSNCADRKKGWGQIIQTNIYGPKTTDPAD